MAKEFKDMVFGLDIGTAKVMVVAAEVLDNGTLRLAGLGIAPTHGLKRGVVVNIDATVASIQQALKEAEMMAACKISSVYTGITGSHIRGLNSTGMVIVRDNHEVTPVDVARVVETAKAINIPNDQRLLLVEPQEFIIDGHEVKEPIGMSGSRLEVKVHIVTGAQSAAENILKWQAARARSAVRGTFSPTGPWRPAVVARLARTLGVTNCAIRSAMNPAVAPRPRSTNRLTLAACVAMVPVESGCSGLRTRRGDRHVSCATQDSRCPCFRTHLSDHRIGQRVSMLSRRPCRRFNGRPRNRLQR